MPSEIGPFIIMATAIIPSLMRNLTGGRDRVTVAGKNLREAISDLDRQFPGIATQLLDDGDIKASIAVSIDGEIGTTGVLEKVGDKSEIHFMPQIAGGII
jgi:molybdopterin synthase sulfur carrier subunit